MMTELLSKHPALKDSQNASGNTLLLNCIKQRLIEEAQRLIQIGADVNLANNVFLLNENRPDKRRCRQHVGMTWRT